MDLDLDYELLPWDLDEDRLPELVTGVPQRYPMTAQEKHQAEPAAREGMCPEGF